MTFDEITEVVMNLTASQKYHFLNSHFKPSRDDNFPSTFLHLCNRAFQYRYLTSYRWMVYSQAVDGTFCAPCAILVPSTKRDKCGHFVNRAFTKWHKMNEAASTHQNTKY